MIPLWARGPLALPPHLSGAAVAATVDDELAGSELPRVLVHLSHCRSCRERLDTERATRDRLRVLNLGEPPLSRGLQGTLLALPQAEAMPARPPAGTTSTTSPSRSPRPVAADHPPPTMRSGAVTAFAAVGLGLGVAAAAAFPVGVGLPASNPTSPAPVAATRSETDRVPAPGWVPRPGRVLSASLPMPPGEVPRPALSPVPLPTPGLVPRTPDAGPAQHREVPLFDQATSAFGQAAWLTSGAGIDLLAAGR